MMKKDGTKLINAVFVSFFNSNNIGDKLISETLLNEIESFGYILVKCSFEGSFKIRNAYTNFNCKYILLNKTVNRIKYYMFWCEFKKKIKKTDLLIIGGGNIIMDLTKKSNSGKYFGKFVDIAKKYHKKVVVLSIGVGPFKLQSQVLSAYEALKKCDFATYRDVDSFKIINPPLPNHYLSIDPVFMMKKKEKLYTKTKKNVIGLGVINSFLFNESLELYEKIKNGYINLANRLVDEGYEVLIFSTEISDFKMINDVFNACSNTKISKKYINSANDLLEIYSKSISFLIAARMHSLIVAYTQFIPLIGLSWQQKVESMFEIINKSKQCFMINDISSNIDAMLQIISSQINNSNFEQETNNRLGELKRQYSINSKILKIVKNDIVGNK